MRRRAFLRAALLSPFSTRMVDVTAAQWGNKLIDIPIEIVGDWRGSSIHDVAAVINLMRKASLANVKLQSDRQPDRLRIEGHTSGPPYIWLHKENPTTGWIVVDVGPNDWCNLVYQFGHELGHVIANSWTFDAKPGGPCQWLEESLVESFSFFGLKRLADTWRVQPPFPNDGNYANAIASHRDRLLQPDWKLAQEQQVASGLQEWFSLHRAALEAQGTVDTARPAVPMILAFFEKNPRLIDDLGAMNRWKGRTQVQLDIYLHHWQASCAELGTPGELPILLSKALMN